MSNPEEFVSDRTEKPGPRFSLGRVVATPGVLAAFDADHGMLDMVSKVYLARYQYGDWGDVCPEDWEANEQAIIHGDRIFAVYTLPHTEVRFYLITEWDRSVTTFLLPEEY